MVTYCHFSDMRSSYLLHADFVWGVALQSEPGRYCWASTASFWWNNGFLHHLYGLSHVWWSSRSTCGLSMLQKWKGKSWLLWDCCNRFQHDYHRYKALLCWSKAVLGKWWCLSLWLLCRVWQSIRSLFDHLWFLHASYARYLWDHRAFIRRKSCDSGSRSSFWQLSRIFSLHTGSALVWPDFVWLFDRSLDSFHNALHVSWNTNGQPQSDCIGSWHRLLEVGSYL